jgi:hypothetical protein
MKKSGRRSMNEEQSLKKEAETEKRSLKLNALLLSTCY